MIRKYYLCTVILIIMISGVSCISKYEKKEGSHPESYKKAVLAPLLV